MTAPAAREIRWGADGLVPAIVVDEADGTVLMLAWMDEAAYAATIATGEVHFHSRSRGRLWRKGETSGNVLRLRAIALDCDGDALLVTAAPAGPTCHTGARSCFDPASADPASAEAARSPDSSRGAEGFGWLEGLWSTIVERSLERPAGSYTVSLLEAGVDGPARKVAEEATEVLMAAKDDAVAEGATGGATGDAAREATQGALVGEVADLLFHLLVLLRERDVPPSRVIEALRARHGR